MIPLLLGCILLAILAQSSGGRRVLRWIRVLVLLGLCVIWIAVVIVVVAYVVHATR